MGNSRNNHHPEIITSFNPSCCLTPLFNRKGTLRRVFGADDDSTTTCSTHSSTQPMRTTHHRLQPVAGEPTSPKIGCMGQINVAKASPSAAVRGRQKLGKLRRMLSGRSLSSPRANRRVADDWSSIPGLDIADMDPPLPVVRGTDKGGNHVSLWSRRCGGQALGGLQLHQGKS